MKEIEDSITILNEIGYKSILLVVVLKLHMKE